MATLTETFTNIADAIRSKTETTDKITPENMPAMIEGITTGGNAEPAVVQELSITSNGTYNAPEGIDGYTPVIVNVPQDGAPPAEAFVITGDCSYRFAYKGWNWFIKQYGNQITTKDITSASHMFEQSDGIIELPFDINFNGYALSTGNNLEYIFTSSNIRKITTFNNCRPQKLENMFAGCSRLNEIPDNFCSNWDWSYLEGLTSVYLGSMARLFHTCRSLKKIPEGLIEHCNPYGNYSCMSAYYGFHQCYILNEIVNLAMADKATWTSNSFYQSFNKCSRLKKLTLKMNDDGTPKIVKWKSQVIDLSEYIGYASSYQDIVEGNYPTGITRDTQITDDATYQALKDNPDNWTTDINYSRYNRTSAVETINSLPDTSAYLASSGGTNTIKFKGASGLLTDGGAINTMTEEEIAVATAKGWTVSFA